MPNEESVAKPVRSPRGARPVMKAFFTALESVPSAMQPAVAKAAQTMIRDQLKLRREKLREAAAKEKARKPAAIKTTARSSKPASPAPVAPAKAKRRTRKQADAAVAA